MNSPFTFRYQNIFLFYSVKFCFHRKSCIHQSYNIVHERRILAIPQYVLNFKSQLLLKNSSKMFGVFQNKARTISIIAERERERKFIEPWPPPRVSRRTTPQIASHRPDRSGIYPRLRKSSGATRAFGALPIRFERAALIFPTNLIKCSLLRPRLLLPLYSSPASPVSLFLSRLNAAGIRALRMWKSPSNAIITETSVKSRSNDDNWMRCLFPSAPRCNEQMHPRARPMHYA